MYSTVYILFSVERWDGGRDEVRDKNVEGHGKRRHDQWDDEYDRGKVRPVNLLPERPFLRPIKTNCFRLPEYVHDVVIFIQEVVSEVLFTPSL